MNNQKIAKELNKVAKSLVSWDNGLYKKLAKMMQQFLSNNFAYNSKWEGIKFKVTISKEMVFCINFISSGGKKLSTADIESFDAKGLIKSANFRDAFSDAKFEALQDLMESNEYGDWTSDYVEDSMEWWIDDNPDATEEEKETQREEFYNSGEELESLDEQFRRESVLLPYGGFDVEIDGREVNTDLRWDSGYNSMMGRFMD